MIRLAGITDCHPGERFLVCGTGSSVDSFPIEFYTRWPGVTIGVNRITDLFTPHYHIDIHERPSIIRSSLNGTDIRFSFTSPSEKIDEEKSGLLSIAGTVALTALTAAYQMGAGKIYLIGVDLQGAHFKGCASVVGKGHLLNHEDELKATLRAFDTAAVVYGTRGVEVTNLSQDSLLGGLNRRGDR